MIPGIPVKDGSSMPRAVRTVLQALSYGGIEVDASRKLADIKKMDPMSIFYKTLDAEVYNGDYKVPIRLFFPTEEAMENGAASGRKPPVILFFHGGGWVTESVENYQRVCARMAQSTGQIVASVEYRLGTGIPFSGGVDGLLCGSEGFLYQPISSEYRSGSYYHYGRQCRRKSGCGCVHDGQRQGRILSEKTDPDLSGTEQLLYRRIAF